jgi:probable HAF family extracellular repeat protein
MVGLGDLPGGDFWSSATAISPDGATIVGESRGRAGSEAFRWTRATGLIGLGDLRGGDFSSRAEAVSAGGQRIVGSSETAAGPEAFLWTPRSGMRPLYAWLSERGLEPPAGWTLERATGISSGGDVIVGVGTNPTGQREGWVVILETPSDQP